MSISRKDALKRLAGIAPNVEAHLQKIANDPSGQDIAHWTAEVTSWIREMEAVLPHVGAKTADEWRQKIDLWKATLGYPQ